MDLIANLEARMDKWEGELKDIKKRVETMEQRTDKIEMKVEFDDIALRVEMLEQLMKPESSDSSATGSFSLLDVQQAPQMQ
jgi:hypothetical protein